MPLQADTLARIALLFQSRGLLTVRELQADLQLGQSRVSRLLMALGSRVIQIGKGQRSRYALRRDVRQLGNNWPIYRIGRDGHVEPWARLQSLHGGFLVEWLHAEPAWLEPAHPDGYFSGLPFFLEELRPQGFLGRLTARALAESGAYLLDPREWSQDDVLTFLLTKGDDLPGDLVVGERMLERAQRRQLAATQPVLVQAERNEAYPKMAERAAKGEAPASSAGGEQPKFLAHVNGPAGIRSVLVKFTAPISTPGAERWADLLLGEWHALETLRAENIPAAAAEIIDAGSRRFLEVERFDRVGPHGRRGVISMLSIEAALLEPSASDWIGAAAGLEAIHLMNKDAAAQLRRLALFGELIGNSDMHLGNMACWFGDQVPFNLAPVYDMLPMQFAPSGQGELVTRTLNPRPPLPESLADWTRACHLALSFWERVRSDPRVSRDFAKLASESHDTLSRLRDRFALSSRQTLEKVPN
jgi:hypothetical protein